MWNNRIVSSGAETPEELARRFNPSNWRKHPEAQRDALEGVLSQVGWVDSVIVNKTTGNLLDGHLRVEQALSAGVDAVPVVYVELTEDEEKVVLATFDPIAAMAEADAEKLDALLEQVNTGGAAIQEMLADLANDAGLYPDDDQVFADTEPREDLAAQLQTEWKTEVGQLWQLGEHRLICGDCTDAEVVGRLMGDDRARLVFADPLYGVNYADKNRAVNRLDNGNRIQTPITNDNLPFEKLSRRVWQPALTRLFEVAAPGCVYYLAGPQGAEVGYALMTALREAGWLLKHTIVWVKNRMVFGRADYHYQHEPLLYGWKPGAGHYFIDDRTQTSVWEFAKPQRSELHPTTKPVALVERAVLNSSRPGDIVADFFLGSGTTLIAAHNLKRRCRAVEIEPKYVAVALQRFKDHAGIEPVLVEE